MRSELSEPIVDVSGHQGCAGLVFGVVRGVLANPPSPGALSAKDHHGLQVVFMLS